LNIKCGRLSRYRQLLMVAGSCADDRINAVSRCWAWAVRIHSSAFARAYPALCGVWVWSRAPPSFGCRRLWRWIVSPYAHWNPVGYCLTGFRQRPVRGWLKAYGG